MFICDRETGAKQFRGLVMSEIHRRRPRRYNFEFSFVGNDRRPSQKSGTRRENRNAPDSPDLSPSIPDDRGYLRFRVFISRQNLGQSGKSRIPDRLGFSRHMKTRLNENIPDRLELSRTTLENRECFYFSGASQISAMVGDYSRQMKPQICTVGDIGDGFRGYMLLISLITNPLNCWAPVPLSQINMASLRQ